MGGGEVGRRSTVSLQGPGGPAPSAPTLSRIPADRHVPLPFGRGLALFLGFPKFLSGQELGLRRKVEGGSSPPSEQAG